MLGCAKSNTYLSFRSAAILAAIMALIELTLVVFAKTNKDLLAVEDGFITLISGISTLALFFAGIRSVGRTRRAWMIIAAAMFFNTLGDISWSIIELILHQNPFPSAADIGYLLFYPFFALGIFLLPEVSLSSREKIKILIDSLIVIVSVALVFWVLLIGPIVISIEALDWSSVVSLAYPVMDLILFIALIELLFRKLASRGQGPIIILALNCALLILTDSIFSIQTQQGTFVSGNILDSGWVICYLLLGLAGIMQANTIPSDRSEALCFFQNRRENWTSNLPFLGIGAVFLLFVWGQEFSRIINYSIVTAAFALLICLMFIRQKVVFDENNEFLAMTMAETAERSRTEDALRESEKEKGAILSGLKKVAVIYLDCEMRIIWVNSSVRDHLQIPEGEIKGRHCFELLQGIDRHC